MLMTCMEHGVTSLVRLAAKCFSDWWFPAHLADLLERMGVDLGDAPADPANPDGLHALGGLTHRDVRR